MKKLVIAGSGGFAGEVEWLIKRINAKGPVWDFLGFIDNERKGPDIVGNDDFVIHHTEELYVSVAIGSPGIREKIYRLYKTNPKVRFANLVDPGVLLSDSVCMGEGNIICAGSILTVNISMGNCNIINLNCTVGHESELGDFVTVNPGVNISGNVRIDSGSNIGTGTQIIQGRRIGKHTTVGAGAVVNKDLPDYCTAVGIPAKVIKYQTGVHDGKNSDYR